MKAGINRCMITPPFTGYELAGFGRPDRVCTGVHDDITLTTLVMLNQNNKCIIICADIIGFDSDFVRKIKKEIEELYGFSKDQVLLNASHTHSGPASLRNMSSSLGRVDERFMTFLHDSVLSSIKTALASVEEVEMFVGKGSCDKIGINRRRMENGVYEFAPYPAGVRNDDVTVIKLVGQEGIKAVLFNYACHPSTIDTDFLSADYPGVARRLIEKKLGGGAAAMFLQGCCGDIRVRTIENNYFRAGKFEDIEYFGSVLSDIVLDICRGDMEKAAPELTAAITEMTLKTQKPTAKERLEEVLKTGAPYQQAWADFVLSNYDTFKGTYPYVLQKLNIGSNIVIYGMDGEVCTPYSIYLKEQNSGKYVITAGYSNGVIGYIPTEEMFPQGGYEPADSIMCYQLPAQFDTGIEKSIKAELDILKDKK